MIFHLIEILLLLAIVCKVYVIDVQHLEWWQTLLIMFLVFGIALIDREFYGTKVDYDKIRTMVRKELERQKNLDEPLKEKGKS